MFLFSQFLFPHRKISFTMYIGYNYSILKQSQFDLDSVDYDRVNWTLDVLFISLLT